MPNVRGIAAHTLPLFATLLLAPVANAQTETAGDAPRTGKAALTAYGGLGVGASLGGGYEDCSAATCKERSRPMAGMVGARFGYELAAGLAFEAELGLLTGGSMKIARDKILLGEQAAPVPTQLVDEVKFGGPMLLAGASYAVIRSPIVLSPAFGLGVLFAKYEVARSGTATTDAPPSPRPMASTTSSSESATHVIAVPEIRAALPIGEHVQLGLSFAALIILDGEIRPKLTQTPTSSPDDPNSKPTSGGRVIGFLPQTNATPESAVEGPIVLFRPTAYTRFLF